MSVKFDAQKALQKLRASGVEEAPAAPVTVEYFDARLGAEFAGLRAEVRHGLLVLGLGLAGFIVAVAGTSLAAAALLFG